MIDKIISTTILIFAVCWVLRQIADDDADKIPTYYKVIVAGCMSSSFIVFVCSMLVKIWA